MPLGIEMSLLLGQSTRQNKVSYRRSVGQCIQEPAGQTLARCGHLHDLVVKQSRINQVLYSQLTYTLHRHFRFSNLIHFEIKAILDPGKADTKLIINTIN